MTFSDDFQIVNRRCQVTVRLQYPASFILDDDDDDDEIYSDVEPDDENSIIVRRVRRFTAADVSHITVLNTVEDEDEELECDINVISMFDRSSCVCLNSCFGHLGDDDVNQNIMNDER